jgi:hypothetical protein
MLFAAGVVLLTVVGLAQSPAPWRTTSIPRLSYREWQGTPCGPGSGRHHSHQFRNNSSAIISFFAAFTYTDGDGKPAKASNYHSLEAGRETSASGSEVCAVPGSVKFELTVEARRR